MGITNQQIAERIDTAIEAMERIVIEMVQTNRELAAKNEKEHKEFRQALIGMSESLILLRERQDRKSETWKTVVTAVLIPTLIAVAGSVLAYVLK